MTHFTDEQRNARPDVAHAVAYAAPLWASAVLVLIAAIVLMTAGNLLGFELSVLAIGIIALATVAAFHMMVRDLQRDSALRSATYRQMLFCQEVIVGLRKRSDRNAGFKAQEYALAGMRQRAHMRKHHQHQR